MTRRLGASLLAAGLMGALLPLSGAVPTAHAAEDAFCFEGAVPDGEVLADSEARTNPPLERMHVPEAQQLTDGTGQRVAVIDSGVRAGVGINQVGAVALPEVSGKPILSGHGTIVAGLISGPDGVAPGAQVLDVRVFDKDEADASQGERPVTSQAIAQGVRLAIEQHRTTPFDIANISLSVESDDPELRQAIKDLVARGVVVVASAGNADTEESETFEGTPDNDAPVYPADYPGVLAVSAVPPDGASPVGYVLPNADTDVAAPTVDGISLNATGQRCTLPDVATSWAAAEVSGVAALLRARFPRDTPKQTVARLLATAEGSEVASNPWSGAGVVQAHDALTQALAPGRSGKLERSVQQDRRDTMPPPPPRRLDLFGSSRALLLWFGLGAGALMALAFMLRSLTRR